jgi:hypothetical protein
MRAKKSSESFEDMTEGNAEQKVAPDCGGIT